mmetsp:Transcript_30997/g.96468  ORF Transcript_30997/g.96468 Transcript_30997/m.96468 type:complete len:245 (-) Transcript_30997:245-979(-)
MGGFALRTTRMKSGSEASAPNASPAPPSLAARTWARMQAASVTLRKACASSPSICTGERRRCNRRRARAARSTCGASTMLAGTSRCFGCSHLSCRARSATRTSSAVGSAGKRRAWRKVKRKRATHSRTWLLSMHVKVQGGVHSSKGPEAGSEPGPLGPGAWSAQASPAVTTGANLKFEMTWPTVRSSTVCSAAAMPRGSRLQTALSRGSFCRALTTWLKLLTLQCLTPSSKRLSKPMVALSAAT